VVAGLETARSRRPGASDRDLARGPARLCKALGIALDHDGTDLVAGPVTLWPAARAAAEVSTGPRVGLRGDPDLPWRFWLAGDPTVSSYRPAVVRKRP
jgi:DNA-3-methyladenine glycosylase